MPAPLAHPSTWMRLPDILKEAEAVLRQINLGARIPLVGLISQYNATGSPPGPNLMPLLVKRALIQGFLVSDYERDYPEFIRDVSDWLKEGKLKYREDRVQGLEHAPKAFLGLFHGKNFGKLIVQVGPDPAMSSSPSRARTT